MKSRKKKTVLAWVAGILVCLMIPGAFVAKSMVNDLRSRVGRDKSFLNKMVRDNYAGKKIDERVLDTSRNQVRNKFAEAEKTKGKFVELGVADTIPSFMDALSNGDELSFNLPVQFERGFMTFTFRVRNGEQDQQVIWSEVSEGIAPHDDVKMRIRKRLP